MTTSTRGVLDVAQAQRRMEALLGTPAIEGAQRSVDLLTYVYWTGRPAQAVATAVAERARAGVAVRVLIDAIGGFPMEPELTALMTDAGAEVHLFRRPWVRSPFTHNHRTHRKILVVDGQMGLTGGVGIAQEWEGDARSPQEWRDTHLRLDGPAVVGLQAAFVQNWTETTAQPETGHRDYPPLRVSGDEVVQVVRGPATVGWDDTQTAWYGLITQARQRIRMATAYFAPDDFFVDLLVQAAGGPRAVADPHRRRRCARAAAPLSLSIG
jgi:cardiolipin synthase